MTNQHLMMSLGNLSMKRTYSQHMPPQLQQEQHRKKYEHDQTSKEYRL